MHKPEALTIAAMMRDLCYVSKDVLAEVSKNMDCSFLEAATGRPASAPGGK